MQPHITERDYAVLRAMGFPLATDFEERNPSPYDVMDAVFRVLRSPIARLVEAAAHALGELAGNVDSNVLVLPRDEKTLRRLGFVLDSLAQHHASSANKSAQLAQWAREVENHLPSLGDVEPLTLTSITTAGRLRRLIENASNVNKKWHVYGVLELRL
ncbi:hypothetical protein L6R29_17920 [Myxococcota bacterium]|nr:hypothetical protein [Myxococcota bacterium]